MADRTAWTRDSAGHLTGKRPHLRLIAGTDVPERTVAAPMAGVPLRPVLSQSHDLLGVAPASWIAAALLFVLLAVALWLRGWTVTPPEPWPETPTTYRVIFAPPPPAPSPPSPPAAAPAPATPEPPPPQAAPTPPEPPPAPVITPPKPEAAAPAPPPAPTVAPAEPMPPPPEPRPAPAPHVEERSPPPPPPKPTPPAVRPHPAPAPLAAPPAAQPSLATAPAPMPPQAAALPLVPPQPISGLTSNPKPVYPAEARRRGQEGRVLLRVEVSAAGLPVSVTVASSSHHSALDEAALVAVRRWHFSPAKRGGVPVAGVADVPIEFRIDD